MTVIISEAQVLEALSPLEAIEQVKLAHLALYNGKAENITRVRSRTPKMSVHILAASSTELGFSATKVYSANKTGIKTLVLLYNNEDGELVAIIEANELGKLRTAAAATLASQVVLSGTLPSDVCLLGTGFQAWGVMESLTALIKSQNLTSTIRVHSRNMQKCQSFVEKGIKTLGSPAKAFECAQEAVEGAQLLITATTSSTPVFEHTWLASTKHISALGSNALSRQEIPPHCVSGAKLVFVDCKETAHREAGNLLKVIENGKILWSQIKELSDVIIHPALAKPEAKGYTLFSSQGLGVQDLYAASLVYHKLRSTASKTVSFSWSAI